MIPFSISTECATNFQYAVQKPLNWLLIFEAQMEGEPSTDIASLSPLRALRQINPTLVLCLEAQEHELMLLACQVVYTTYNRKRESNEARTVHSHAKQVLKTLLLAEGEAAMLARGV